MTKGLQGLDAMIATLGTIKDKSVKKATKAGVNAGLTPLAKAMRSAINASDADPSLKKVARKSIGKRLKRKQGKYYQGKVGFKVGKRGTTKMEKRAASAASARVGDKSRAGVGFSITNIHWAVLGTDARHWKSTGKATGTFPAQLPGIAQAAVAFAGGAMLEAARKKITQVLAREAAKARKR